MSWATALELLLDDVSEASHVPGARSVFQIQIGTNCDDFQMQDLVVGSHLERLRVKVLMPINRLSAFQSTGFCAWDTTGMCSA